MVYKPTPKNCYVKRQRQKKILYMELLNGYIIVVVLWENTGDLQLSNFGIRMLFSNAENEYHLRTSV